MEREFCDIGNYHKFKNELILATQYQNTHGSICLENNYKENNVYNNNRIDGYTTMCISPSSMCVSPQTLCGYNLVTIPQKEIHYE